MPPLTPWMGRVDSPRHPHDYNCSPNLLGELAESDQELVPGSYTVVVLVCADHQVARDMATSLDAAVSTAWRDWHVDVAVMDPAPLTSTMRVQQFP
jgi:hypothetical protein